MTAREIALTFMHDRYQRNLCLPNYTPHHWFECDVFEVSEAGYFREYEIKVSRSDFFADADKSHHRKGTKHQALESGNTSGPNYFAFIVPENLVSIQEVPEWAGLIYARIRGDGHRVPHRLWLHRVKDGRRLHTQKINPQVWKHARGVCYYRYHTAILEAANRDKAALPISAPTGE